MKQEEPKKKKNSEELIEIPHKDDDDWKWDDSKFITINDLDD